MEFSTFVKVWEALALAGTFIIAMWAFHRTVKAEAALKDVIQGLADLAKILESQAAINNMLRNRITALERLPRV